MSTRPADEQRRQPGYAQASEATLKHLRLQGGRREVDLIVVPYGRDDEPSKTKSVTKCHVGTTAARPATLIAMPVASAAPRTAGRIEDQRVILDNVSWADFEMILQIRGDQAGVRVTYSNGVLELMSPSVDHEGVKTTLGRLLEAYAEERGITLNGFGSWTLKRATRARALEPDECYSLSSGRPSLPDLAIEVAWTSGGIDKLDVYRGLGVGEVWLWREGIIEIHVLAGEQYERRTQSALLPELDLETLAQHLDPEHQTESVRRYREALRAAR